MIKEGGQTDKSRLDFAFRLVTARRPRPHESSLLAAALSALAADFRQHPDAARALTQVGEAPCDESLDAPQVASYTAIANALLSSDESISK